MARKWRHISQRARRGPDKAERMRCPRCHQAAEPDAPFCTYCAAPIDDASARRAAARTGVILVAVLDLIGAAPPVLVLGVVGIFGAGPLGRPGPALWGLLLVLSMLHLGAAAGLALFRRWGRTLHLALSVIYLFVFPVGTVLAGLTSWYLFRRDVQIVLDGSPSTSDEDGRAPRAAA